MSIRSRIAAVWHYLKNYGSHFRKRHLLYAALLIVLVFVISSRVQDMYAFRDDDAERGATAVGQDTFGDKFTRVAYVDQNWDESQSLWFYNTTQGSDLLPYDFFMVLEKAGTTELLRSNENINRYRYLPRKATSANPDALPIGFVRDHYKGRQYLGLTCAACHTSQLNYNGVGIRIDGGPAGADMDMLLNEMVQSLAAANDRKNPAHARFVKNVRARGNYDTDEEVIADLERYMRRIAMYEIVNKPEHPYGYARMDAFGRIYNRVLEHILSAAAFRQVLNELVADGKITEQKFDSISAMVPAKRVLSPSDRDVILKQIHASLSPDQQQALRNKIFNAPTAPVSYPFLWDIPQHDFVQWNGIVANAGLGPIGRNTGEVIGVFATLDWALEQGFSFSAFLGGQGVSGPHISYESSVDVRNLRKIERQLRDLESPVWPDSLLPPIDKARAARGEHLFARQCAECHAEIDRADPQRRVVAHIASLDEAGTDSAMAVNSVKYAGRSGILRNQYVKTGVGDILLDTRAPVAALLTQATQGVVATPNPDHSQLRRGYEWARELVAALLSNEIKPSIRRGKYNPDNTVDPYASIVSYKARSLNGIWATAPYLHNGSVPTLYDLLLPARQRGNTSAGAFRPDSFMVGSREFDPVRVGFKSSGYEGFLFNASLPGNSNAGHEYPRPCNAVMATKPPVPIDEKSPLAPPLAPPSEDTAPPCGLTEEDRLSLVEYLKTL